MLFIRLSFFPYLMYSSPLPVSVCFIVIFAHCERLLLCHEANHLAVIVLHGCYSEADPLSVSLTWGSLNTFFPFD